MNDRVTKFVDAMNKIPDITECIMEMDKKGIITEIRNHVKDGCEDCKHLKKRDRLRSGIISAPQAMYKAAFLMDFYNSPEAYGFKPEKRDEIMQFGIDAAAKSSSSEMLQAVLAKILGQPEKEEAN